MSWKIYYIKMQPDTNKNIMAEQEAMRIRKRYKENFFPFDNQRGALLALS